MKCIVCDDELDDFGHKDADLLECWKEINNLTYFKGNIKLENLRAWLAGPTDSASAQDKIHKVLTKAYGRQKTNDQLYSIINEAREYCYE